VPFALPFPARRTQAAGGAVLIDLRPQSVRLLNASFQNFAERGAGARLQSRRYDLLPSIAFVPLDLLGDAATGNRPEATIARLVTKIRAV